LKNRQGGANGKNIDSAKEDEAFNLFRELGGRLPG
jgi:hypothetical protein